MLRLSNYLNENIKDKLSHFISKAMFPDSTVKTAEYIRDIFEVAIDKSKYDYIKSAFLSLRWHEIEDLLDSKSNHNALIEWKYVKNQKGFIEYKDEHWDSNDIEDDDYVIPYGPGMKRIDSGDKFTILPFVINKKSLYSTGCAYRDGKFIKTKEDIWKYIVEPADKLMK